MNTKVNTNKLDKFITDAITNGKSSNITPVKLDENPKQFTMAVNDQFEDRQAKLDYLEEITRIDNSIISMHQSLSRQEQLANAMMKYALGGTLPDENGQDGKEVLATIDMEVLNLASLAQSRVYQSKRDFHSHVLTYNKSSTPITSTSSEAIDVEAMKAELQQQVQDAIKERTKQMNVVNSIAKEIKNEPITKE